MVNFTSKLASVAFRAYDAKDEKSKALYEIEKLGYKRPFAALCAFTQGDRANIAESLDIKFPKKVRGVTELEASHILTCNRMGIIWRLSNNFSENLNPLKDKPNWRKLLMRVVDKYAEFIPANASEEDLEEVFLKLAGYEQSNIDVPIKKANKRTDKKQGIPTKTLGKIKIKNKDNNTTFDGSLVATALHEVHDVTEFILNSSDRPAINTILSICIKLREENCSLEVIEG